MTQPQAYEYVAWIRDNSLAEGDPDREWPAVFIVTAGTAAEAQAWGDHLAQARFSPGESEELIRSVIGPVGESSSANLSDVPVVPHGYEATAAEIGW